jgi:hypothetical protein
MRVGLEGDAHFLISSAVCCSSTAFRLLGLVVSVSAMALPRSEMGGGFEREA